MYSTTPNVPKSDDIANEHWRILTDAIAALGESDSDCGPAYQALDYFRARVIRQGGINLITAGLRDGRAEYLQLGLRLLRQHLGGIITEERHAD